MGKELEYKFAATSGQLDQIEAAFAPMDQTLQMQTTYYDTSDGALAARKWTLRLRMENGSPVCTLKTPAQGCGRNEWECRCDRIEDAIAVLCSLSGSHLLAALTLPGLVPVCGARFTRRVKRLRQQTLEVELALDQGILFGGGRELPFAEAETELKAGSEQDLLCFAQAFSRQFSLSVEPKSKFRRALGLAKGE